MEWTAIENKWESIKALSGGYSLHNNHNSIMMNSDKWQTAAYLGVFLSLHGHQKNNLRDQ